MSVLKAIFQAVGQALTWVLPVSESGHSSIFHNFSGRYTDACSQLTGVVHIGIAIGLILAFFNLFKVMFANFFATFNEIFHKRLQPKNTKPARSFMYMTLLSFVPMLLYLIPAGKYTNVYGLLHSTSYNETLTGEGVCMLLTGVLLLVTIALADKRLNPLPKVLQSILIGIVVFLAVPVAGCSVIGAVFCFGVIFGMSEKLSLRYSAVMSVMILIVMGIFELCTAVTKITVIIAVIALIVSAVFSWLFAKLLLFLIKSKKLKSIGIYDISVGVLCLVIGIFQVIIN